MYRCIHCGERIPLKVVYLYSFFGFCIDYKCNRCKNRLFHKVHYIIMILYISLLEFIWFVFTLLCNFWYGLVISLITLLLIGPLYFKILLLAEKRSRKCESNKSKEKKRQ